MSRFSQTSSHTGHLQAPPTFWLMHKWKENNYGAVIYEETGKTPHGVVLSSFHCASSWKLDWVEIHMNFYSVHYIFIYIHITQSSYLPTHSWPSVLHYLKHVLNMLFTQLWPGIEIRQAPSWDRNKLKNAELLGNCQAFCMWARYLMKI